MRHVIISRNTEIFPRLSFFVVFLLASVFLLSLFGRLLKDGVTSVRRCSRNGTICFNVI